MARGRDAHQARKAALAALGRGLARRARSKCELCGESGSHTVPLDAAAEPDLDGVLLLCARCRELFENGRHDGLDSLRFLEGAVWSELAPAQVVAVKLLERLAPDAEASWPRDTLDGLWLDEAVRARVDALP